MMRISLKLLVILLVAGLLYLYLVSSLHHAFYVNTDVKEMDQGCYIEAALRIRENEGWYLGDRNRMPLYQYLLALFLNQDKNSDTLFIYGKMFNIYFSLLLLGVIFLVIVRYLSLFGSLTYVALVGFSLFIFKAAYVQVEILFYTLSFITFMLFNSAIATDRKRTAMLAGISAAVAYLAKATMLLGVYIFLGFQVVRLFFHTYEYRLKREKKNLEKSKRILISLTVFILTFITLLSPYLIENKRLYGRYFFNLNTSYYFWADSWDAVKNVEIRLDDLQLVENKQPSLSKYLRSHSLVDIASRLKAGLAVIWMVLVRFPYYRLASAAIIYYTIITSGVFIFNFKYFRKKGRKILINAGFSMIYIAIYILAFAWYQRIALMRLLLSLYLPWIFACFWMVEKTEKFTAHKLKVKGSSLRLIIHGLALLGLALGVNHYVLGMISTYHFGG